MEKRQESAKKGHISLAIVVISETLHTLAAFLRCWMLVGGRERGEGTIGTVEGRIERGENASRKTITDVIGCSEAETLILIIGSGEVY